MSGPEQEAVRVLRWLLTEPYDVVVYEGTVSGVPFGLEHDRVGVGDSDQVCCRAWFGPHGGCLVVQAPDGVDRTTMQAARATIDALEAALEAR